MSDMNVKEKVKRYRCFQNKFDFIGNYIMLFFLFIVKFLKKHFVKKRFSKEYSLKKS